MATMQELEQALVKADAAGNADDARVFANEIRRMRAQAPAPQQQAEPQRSMFQRAGDVVAGAVRGAGSIGATLLTPIDAAARALGVQNDFIGRTDRRQAMDDALRTAGADTDSWAYKGGKLAGEIAGTAGAGSVVAGGMRAIPALAKLAPVVQSGGMTLGPAATGSRVANLALRAAGGAASGATTAALVNPEDALAGAVAGGSFPVAIKGAQYAGKAARGAVKHGIGKLTGTSAETLGEAYRAGRGGNQTFLQHMRGGAEFDDVVNAAQAGLDKMRLERAAKYRDGMIDISADKTVLDFAPVDAALQRIQNMGSFKGVPINKNASGVVNELSDTISQWRALDPASYHTPEGMDALKRSIGDIRGATQPGSPARRAADDVYHAVKAEIDKQMPVYSNVMRDYSKASSELEEITKALSVKEGTSKDTAIRKLQSLMRNNAQTNYGNRLSLARQLEQKGGVEITPAVAGQALNSWAPRGMAGAIQAGGLGLGAWQLNPSLLAALPLTSPRLMGEAAYKAGLLSSAAGNAGARAAGVLSPQAWEIGRGLLSAAPGVLAANR